MENFILWSVSFDSSSQKLSFFASSVHRKGINEGTDEMITQMLDDLEYSDVPYTAWSIHPCITNYLLDNPPSDNWEDNWSNTWEIQLDLQEPVVVKQDDTELTRTVARDMTWSRSLEHLPSECIVVADFYSDNNTDRFRQVLGTMTKAPQQAETVEKLHQLLPEIAEDVLNQVYTKLLEQTLSGGLKLRQRPGLPRQCIISLGVVDEQFFIDGAPTVEHITLLVNALNGTTTWDERTDPRRMST